MGDNMMNENDKVIFESILNSAQPTNYNLEKHLIKKAHPEFTETEILAYILGFSECAELIRKLYHEGYIKYWNNSLDKFLYLWYNTMRKDGELDEYILW